jgi:hypothetical protein
MEGWLRGESETSPPNTAALFDEHIQLEDLLEVSTTTEPGEKTNKGSGGSVSGQSIRVNGYKLARCRSSRGSPICIVGGS